VKELSSREKK